MNAAPQLYLLDGSSYIYRAYYGVRDIATSGGMPTNAVFGFIRMLLGLLQENRPDYLAVVFDPPREETFRRELYPPYKAHRDAMPADLVPQLPYIREKQGHFPYFSEKIPHEMTETRPLRASAATWMKALRTNMKKLLHKPSRIDIVITRR